MNEMQREAELLRQFGLFVRENCYYSIGEDDDEPSRISNFIMEPLFHIEDEINGTRIFRMRNMYNVCRVIELKESELCSLSNFQQKVGSLGNYVWLSKIDKLNRVKEYLYSKTDTAERIRKLGWNAAAVCSLGKTVTTPSVKMMMNRQESPTSSWNRYSISRMR